MGVVAATTPIGEASLRDGSPLPPKGGRVLALAGLMLALVAGAASAQPAGVAAKGAEVFDDRCSGCHGEVGGQGPSLAGVVGRHAGSLPGFDYTPALKASGLTWTPANLDRFLTGPKALVPGTAMAVIVPDPTERRDLIAYLASLKAR
jgi:cytochrome c